MVVITCCSRLVVRASTDGTTPGGGSRPRPSAPLSLSSTSPMDHHDSSLLQPHHDLDQAERELVHHCASLLPGDDKAEACWEAWRFLEAKREVAESECEVGDGGDCSKLERLDAFMHDLNGTGEVSALVSALGTLARAEARAAARATGEPAEPAAAAAAEQHVPGGELSPGRKAELTALFRSADHNGDGLMDPEEFRSAMRRLGEELPNGTVATILECFAASPERGSPPGLTLEQFTQIVEAEEVQSKAAVDRLWRRHAMRPSWWTLD